MEFKTCKKNRRHPYFLYNYNKRKVPLKMEKKSGRLELIIGNMFSGKSTELMRRINKEKSIDKKILVINYSLDNRYSTDSISTHDNVSIKCLKVSNLLDISSSLLFNSDSIFIDEAQFFPDLYDFCIGLVDSCNKHVVVSGLDGDFNRNEFGSILKLIPICDTVDKLSAYCKICNNSTVAPFTIKIDNHTDLIDIGSSEKYMSVCRYHYKENCF